MNWANPFQVMEEAMQREKKIERKQTLAQAFKKLKKTQKENKKQLTHLDKKERDFGKKVEKTYEKEAPKILHKVRKEYEKEKVEKLKKELLDYHGWLPRIWSNNGIERKKIQIYPLFENYSNNFKIYVSNQKQFNSQFDKVNIRDTSKGEFVHKEKPSLDNPYHVSIFVGYLLGNKCGFCREHMQSSSDNISIPNVISCLGKYFLYFHMVRFLTMPGSLNSLLSES